MGRASSEGTARIRERLGRVFDEGYFRSQRVGSRELWLSSIGLGTYLGEADHETDKAYEAAAGEALRRGVNVFDTAINYRHQRSERALGKALRSAFDRGEASRDEMFVSTKAGFFPFDGEPPAEPQEYFQERFFRSGLLEPGDVAGGCHALRPEYLDDQLERSRANLGLETIDLFYLHNPETQFEHGADEALARIEAALAWARGAVEDGRIGAVGLATWDGLRTPPGQPNHLPLGSLLEFEGRAPIAAIQLPLNLAMPEALAAPTQELYEAIVPVLVLARQANLAVFTSASILQGRLARDLPAEIEAAFPGLDSDAQRALQFTRSVPGVTTALVGMSSTEHVRENLALAGVEPAPPEALQRLFSGGVH